MIKQNVAIRGESDPMGGSVEQAPACQFFEATDVLADGRLLQPEDTGGARKTAGIGDSGKALQEIDGDMVHGHHDI